MKSKYQFSEKPELSIIIITLNEEKYLPALLDSIKNQNYDNYEIIVADFNSKDKTRQIAKKYRCKITSGGDYSVGRNNGAKVSKGKYLLFLDADCWLSRDFLKKNLRAFKEFGKGVGTIKVCPFGKKYFDKFFFGAYNFWSRIMSYISPHCAGCGIFTSKKIFEKLHGFNEKIIFGENHEFAKRAKKQGYGFIILPKPIYTSVRRMDKDGRPKFIAKYIYAGLYRLLYKEIKKPIFEYDDKRD